MDLTTALVTLAAGMANVIVTLFAAYLAYLAKTQGQTNEAQGKQVEAKVDDQAKKLEVIHQATNGMSKKLEDAAFVRGNIEGAAVERQKSEDRGNRT